MILSLLLCQYVLLNKKNKERPKKMSPRDSQANSNMITLVITLIHTSNSGCSNFLSQRRRRWTFSRMAGANSNQLPTSFGMLISVEHIDVCMNLIRLHAAFKLGHLLFFFPAQKHKICNTSAQ